MHEALAESAFARDLTHIGAIAPLRGWVVVASSYPQLDVSFSASGRTTLRLQVNCTGWPAEPPSFLLCNQDGTPLTTVPAAPGGQFHQGPHHLTGRPYVGMRGSREYHTHPSHVGDHWDNYRGRSEFTLGGILTQVWNAWLKASP
jgi:hypothetical protein